MQKNMLDSFMSDSFRNGYHDKTKRMYFIVVVLKYCFESRVIRNIFAKMQLTY